MDEPGLDLGRDLRGDEDRVGLRSGIIALRFPDSGAPLIRDRLHAIAFCPFPFLNRPESAENPGMAKRVVDVLVPVALDHAYSYRVPARA